MDFRESVSQNNIVAWLILGYLCSHPSAKDTAVGISRWWLRSAGVVTNESAVEKALNYLALRDWLTITKTPSGGLLYGLNLLKQDILQQFLHPLTVFTRIKGRQSQARLTGPRSKRILLPVEPSEDSPSLSRSTAD